jgi:hypothetical protein
MMPHDESTRAGALVRRGTMCSIGTHDGDPEEYNGRSAGDRALGL